MCVRAKWWRCSFEIVKNMARVGCLGAGWFFAGMENTFCASVTRGLLFSLTL